MHYRRSLQKIQPGRAGADKFRAGALEALTVRAGLQDEPQTPEARELQYHSLVDLGREALRAAGHSPNLLPEDLARAMLGLDGPWGSGAANAPGDFPNILSALADKLIDQPADDATITFRQWAYKMRSVPDFKPKTIVALGEFGELPYHVDGHDFIDSTFETELGWLQVASYGDEFRLTPTMIVNDDVDAFAEAIEDKRTAHDARVNRLCVSLLVDNPTLMDGYALFDDTNHANDITSGAAPDTTELDKVRKKLRAQTGVSAKRTMGYSCSYVLVPSELETTTEQLLKATLQTYPTAATGANVFRGATSYGVEPMLSEDSSAKWYGFGPPRRTRAIVYCHQAGYERMRQSSYANPRNQCRHFQFEGRFAVAVRNYRGVVRNAGA